MEIDEKKIEALKPRRGQLREAEHGPVAWMVDKAMPISMGQEENEIISIIDADREWGDYYSFS